jgi:ribose transport system substrate-binding protein
VFDAVPGVDQLIRSGLVDIAIAQRPDEIGYYGVKFAVDAIHGKTIPPYKSTGFMVLDKTNIDQPDMKQYIYSN